MYNKKVFLLILSFLLFGCSKSFSVPPDVTIIKKYFLSDVEVNVVKFKNIRLTHYQNLVEQTDIAPNITASGRVVYEGSVAVSQDFLINKNVNYGDIVYIEKLGGFFTIEDCMNERFKKAIDIFTFSKNSDLAKNAHGKTTVYILKIVK